MEKALEPYLEEFGSPRFDGPVRQAWNTRIEATEPHVWRVSQLLDADEENGWAIEGVVDLRDDTNPSGTIVQVLEITE